MASPAHQCWRTAHRLESNWRPSRAMTFEEILEQAIATLRRRRRVSYRALKVQLDLSDDVLEAVKDELVYAQRIAPDEDGRVLVWRGDTAPAPSDSVAIESQSRDGQRRQLTVLFCDLVE